MDQTNSDISDKEVKPDEDQAKEGSSGKSSDEKSFASSAVDNDPIRVLQLSQPFFVPDTDDESLMIPPTPEDAVPYMVPSTPDLTQDKKEESMIADETIVSALRGFQSDYGSDFSKAFKSPKGTENKNESFKDTSNITDVTDDISDLSKSDLESSLLKAPCEKNGESRDDDDAGEWHLQLTGTEGTQGFGLTEDDKRTIEIESSDSVKPFQEDSSRKFDSQDQHSAMSEHSAITTGPPIIEDLSDDEIEPSQSMLTQYQGETIFCTSKLQSQFHESQKVNGSDKEVPDVEIPSKDRVPNVKQIRAKDSDLVRIKNDDSTLQVNEFAETKNDSLPLKENNASDFKDSQKLIPESSAAELTKDQPKHDNDVPELKTNSLPTQENNVIELKCDDRSTRENSIQLEIDDLPTQELLDHDTDPLQSSSAPVESMEVQALDIKEISKTVENGEKETIGSEVAAKEKVGTFLTPKTPFRSKKAPTSSKKQKIEVSPEADIAKTEPGELLGSFSDLSSLKNIFTTNSIKLENEDENLGIMVSAKPNEEKIFVKRVYIKVKDNKVYLKKDTFEPYYPEKAFHFEESPHSSSTSTVTSGSTKTSFHSGELADISSSCSSKSANSSHHENSILLSSQDSSSFVKTSTQNSETQTTFPIPGTKFFEEVAEAKPKTPKKRSPSIKSKASGKTPKIPLSPIKYDVSEKDIETPESKSKTKGKRSATPQTEGKTQKKQRKTKLSVKRKISNITSTDDQSSGPKDAAEPKKRIKRKKEAVPSHMIENEVTQLLEATKQEEPFELIEEPCDESHFGNIIPGVRVMAPWTDGYYYPGMVQSQQLEGRWTVMFEDKFSRVIPQENLIKQALLKVGTSILVLSSDGHFYDPGIVCGHYKEGNNAGYVVELDRGITKRFPRAAVILSTDQAKILSSSRPPTTPASVTINLDNIVDGKRKRKSLQSLPPSPTVKKSPRVSVRTRSTGDPNLDPTDSSANEVTLVERFLAETMNDSEVKAKKVAPRHKKGTPKSGGKKTSTKSDIISSSDTDLSVVKTTKKSNTVLKVVEDLSTKVQQPALRQKRTTSRNFESAPAKAGIKTSSDSDVFTSKTARSIKKLLPAQTGSNMSPSVMHALIAKTARNVTKLLLPLQTDSSISSSDTDGYIAKTVVRNVKKVLTAQTEGSSDPDVLIERSVKRVPAKSERMASSSSNVSIVQPNKKKSAKEKERLFTDYAFLLSNAEKRFKPEGSIYSDSEDSILPFDKVELCDEILSEGGLILDTFEDTTTCDRKHIYLLANTYLRTIKYLQCLAAGIPCIKHHWVKNSIQVRDVLDIRNFYLPSGYSLVERNVIEWHGNDSILKDMKIALISEKKSQFVHIWTPVLLAAKANFVQKWTLPTSSPNSSDVVDVLVTNAYCPSNILSSAKKRKIPIVSSEWIIQCLVSGQRLPFDAHQKFTHNYTE